MGLKEAFSRVRGQILLIDPYPPINKVFSLALQEERQMKISLVSSLDIESIALITKSSIPKNDGKFSRNDRHLCAHYGVAGHTIEKCYKLHSYPFHF